MGPALELSADDVSAALSVYDPSLAWVRARWPDIPVTVVYIPAPLTVYANAGTSKLATRSPFGPKGMTFVLEGPNGKSATDLLDGRSNLICERVRAIFLGGEPGGARACSRRASRMVSDPLTKPFYRHGPGRPPRFANAD